MGGVNLLKKWCFECFFWAYIARGIRVSIVFEKIIRRFLPRHLHGWKCGVHLQPVFSAK